MAGHDYLAQLLQPCHVIIVLPPLYSATASQTIRWGSSRNKRELYIISSGPVSRTKREPLAADDASPQLASSLDFLPTSCRCCGTRGRVNHIRACDVTDRRACAVRLAKASWEGYPPSAGGEPRNFRQLASQPSHPRGSPRFFSAIPLVFVYSSDSQSSSLSRKVC